MRAIPLTIVLLLARLARARPASKSRSTACPRSSATPCARRSSSTTTTKRDISPAELRSAFKDADEQIKQRARALWLLRLARSPSNSPAMQRTAGRRDSTWRPAIRRSCARRTSKCWARARNSGACAEAVDGFAPKVGDRLDHATYEASKAVIDTTLRGAGFLDAKYTQRRVTVRPEEKSADVDLTWESGPRYKFGAVRFAGDAPFPEEFLREFVSVARRRVLQLRAGAQPAAAAGRCRLLRAGVGAAGARREEGRHGAHRRAAEARRTHGVFGRGLLQHRLRRRRARGRGAPLAQQEGPQGRCEGRILASACRKRGCTTRFRGRAAKTAPTTSASAIATRPPTSTARATSSSRPRARRSAGMVSRARSGSSISTATSRSARTRTISSSAAPSCCSPKAR